jgi:hypothetical protein
VEGFVSKHRCALLREVVVAAKATVYDLLAVDLHEAIGLQAVE